MKNPTTNIQEVLYTMIKKGHVSLFDFPYLAGFRTRVSELALNYGLKFVTKKHIRVNKFGNTYTYSIHFLKDKNQAIDLYNKMTL